MNCKYTVKSLQVFLAAFLFILLSVDSVTASELRSGASTVIITPPVGTALSGYYYERGATGVHDELHARTLVIAEDDITVALIACDLIDLPAYLAHDMREEIERKTGVTAGNIMISATHTHTGPVLPDTRQKLADSKSSLSAYIRQLPAKLADGVQKAIKDLEPAGLQVATGQENSINFNRRFLMKDGTVGWNPGKLNPGIIKPAGPIDPEVVVIYAESDSGNPIATYVNFALHLDTVGGTEFSADFPYTLINLLENAKKQDMLAMFTNGCCGNVNHIDVTWSERQKGHAEAARIGTVLAGEVLKTCRRLQSTEIDTIMVRNQIVELPLAKVDPAEEKKAHEIRLTYGTENPAPFLELVHAFKVADVLHQKGKPIRAEVQVIALGSQIAVVSLPGEIFTELGLAIKAASPFPVTVVASLTNGNIGYVPDRKAYDEGNYEPVSARCGPGSGEILVTAAVEMLQELYP